MLTSEDRAERHPVDVDTTPALRRVGSHALNWWTALLIVCGPATLLLALLLVAPFVAVAFALGLAGTCARYLVRRDWGALAHIGAGLGLVVAGYVTARGLHHGGVPTLTAWTGHVRSTAGNGESFDHVALLMAAVVASAAWFVGLAGLTAGSTYALVRPYRTRFSRPAVLAACALVGLAIGLG